MTDEIGSEEISRYLSPGDRFTVEGLWMGPDRRFYKCEPGKETVFIYDGDGISHPDWGQDHIPPRSKR